MSYKYQTDKPLRFFVAILFIVALLVHNPLTVKSAIASCSSAASPGVDWQGCRKRNLIMTDFNFSGSNFEKTDLSSSDLRGAILTGSNLTKANLVRASLKGVKADKANFTGVIAYRTDFGSSNFTGANFSKAEIIRADFTKSIMANTDMSKGEFSRADFSGAKITGVKFDYSNLARSDFRGSQIKAPVSMKGAFIFLTRLEGLDLSNVEGLADWQLEMACGDDTTKLPDGMSQPPNWPCAEEN